MLNGDPWDGFFFPTLTLMIDSYILAQIQRSFQKNIPTLTLCVLVPSVDIIKKQFGTRAGSKLFDTHIVFLMLFLKKMVL